MQRLLFIISSVLLMGVANSATELEKKLARTYMIWQKAMVNKDYKAWDAIMASERKKEVKNRIYSEKFGFPSRVFQAPFSPPSIRDLKMLQAKESGNFAKAVFFGKVDFNVGGAPTENLLVVSYQNQANYWRFVKAEYVNLASLPDVRKQLLSGDYTYLSHLDFTPTPYKRKNHVELKGPVSIIAKVYAYCPGREVKTIFNDRSNHLFQNTKEAEVAIGGAALGMNNIQMAIQSLPGGQKDEPICVRVYLLSQVNGVKPIKAYEYLVPEGGSVKQIHTGKFEVTPDMVNKLLGK